MVKETDKHKRKLKEELKLLSDSALAILCEESKKEINRRWKERAEKCQK